MIFFILVHGVKNKKISNNFRPLKRKKKEKKFSSSFSVVLLCLSASKIRPCHCQLSEHTGTLLASCVTTLICISTYTGIYALISTFHCPSFNVNFQYFTCNLSMFNIFVMIIFNSMLTIWPTVCICTYSNWQIHYRIYNIIN